LIAQPDEQCNFSVFLPSFIHLTTTQNPASPSNRAVCVSPRERRGGALFVPGSSKGEQVLALLIKQKYKKKNSIFTL
jgi:hypothetical protein